MLEVNIYDEQNHLNNSQKQLIEEILNVAYEKLHLSGPYEVAITILSDHAIHQLNLKYRQVDRSTDVLSFPLLEQGNNESKILGIPEEFPTSLGDIFISYKTCENQAKAYRHSVERELAFLAVHGFLHLNGYDHQTPLEEAAMFKLQDDILNAYGLKR